MKTQHYIILLERKAFGVLIQLKTGKITVTQAKFSSLLDEMKKHDEALWETMFTKYIKVVKDLNEELTK